MILDIFDADAFSVHELTLAIDRLPYVPGRLGRMNLFTPKPITTSTAIIEERAGSLSLLPTMPRGSEQQTVRPGERRKVRAFPVPHVPYWRSIRAEDLEGRRAFGTEDQVEVFSQVVNDELEGMKADHELTFEYHRIGAVRGIVLDADGVTEVINWFTEFGVSQTVIDVNFYDAGNYSLPEPVVVIKSIAQQIKREIQNALGATPFTGMHALCGDEFFDALVAHATVRQAWEYYQSNQWARELQDSEGGFLFNGIIWENYRGSVGSVDFIPTDEAIVFPTGVRDVFVKAIAPADFIETVNTRGQEIYAKQERIKWDKGVELHTQSNVLHICTKPLALIKLTMSNELPTTTTAATTTEATTTA